MSLLNKKIISNSFWMMFEKLIGIFGLIFVTSYVAKYIGPDNFGKIALATTVFTFVQTLTWFGNQEILFKRVSKNSSLGLQYLYSTQRVRKLLFSILSIPIIAFFYFYSDQLTLIFSIATAISVYFVTQDIYAIYNNAILTSYINAIVNMIGLCLALFIRYIIVYFEWDVQFLAIPIVLVSLVPYLLKKHLFNKKNVAREVKNKAYTKYYFFAGSALVISTLSISLYTQVNSLFLAAFSSTYNLGLYAAAVPLGMAWSFVNSAIITSVLSKIYQEKDPYKSYVMVAQLNLIIIIISLLVIITLAITGKWIITKLYGYDYLASYELLAVLAFATMFSGLGTITARLMVKEESYSYISRKMLFVALLSVPISFFMIKLYGIKGAAYSVLLIEFLSATLFNYFYKNGLILRIHFFPFFIKDIKNKYKVIH
ncbi:oligosaccharide flippase family protein [Psychrobacter pacificensis]|uniref:oligosaccharide flippase family protein n=1 Tax=Psychrobacter pacificensis TaxID=112002 RepID=UPI003CFCE8FC